MNQVKDVKPNNIIVKDEKPKNKVSTPPIIDQLYEVVTGAGMYIGVPFLLTYPETGTSITPYTK